MKKGLYFGILCIVCVILSSYLAEGYKMEPPNNIVHQYISNESQEVWEQIPYEIKNHLRGSLRSGNGNNDYNDGDNIINGSSEEDFSSNPSAHFWEPDTPNSGEYDDGLFGFESSWERAHRYWITNVIPNYLNGDINQSYYWFGRVVHLLEDATVPAHVHLDQHLIDDDALEEFTVLQNFWGHGTYNYRYFDGKNYQNQYYRYENLTYFTNAQWEAVNNRLREASYPKELFKLLWFTAQKTQYFASDDADGDNGAYREQNGTQRIFSPSLWDTSQIIVADNANIEDATNNGTNIAVIANASIPHAMKSVAGLYRLFWDAVQVDWKFYHHDLRNTGYTLLKGDITTNNKQIWNYSSAPATDFWDEAVIAEIDNNLSDGQEIIVATANSDYTDGRVYALDGKTNKELWSFNDTLAAEPPSVDDVDGDGIKEVIVGSHDLYLYNIYSNNGTKKWRYLINNQTDAFGPWRSAIADINNDGSKEIVFGEEGKTGTYNGHVVALNSNGKQVWNSSTTAVQGFQTNPAIADLNGDGVPEVIITAGDGVYVYNGSNGVELWRKHMANVYESPVIADLDNDNDYEVIVATSNNTIPGELCAYNKCYSGINVLDHNGNMLWNASVDYYVISIPAVANLDNDSNLEIVVATAQNPDFVNLRNTNYNNGSVYVFDGVTGNMEWGTKFVAGAKIQSSPAIADIDNDGKLEIIFGAYDGLLYVLAQNKSIEWTHNFSSYLIANPAIGDIDGDGVAEIVVKHANHLGPSSGAFGGGQMLFTNNSFMKANQFFLSASSSSDPSTLEALGGTNIKPVLNQIHNISVNEGDLVNVNASGEVMATDANNDSLTFYYSSPLNTSGFWQTDCNSSGNYTVLVEVSDGNLSDFTYVNVQVNESCFPDVNKFLTHNSSGSNIAWFGDSGNIVIKGVLEQNSNFQATDNFAFKIRNNLNDVLIIENNGSMYIDGTLFENQGTITSDINRNDFRIKNNGNLVANVNETGYIFLKGTLMQNGNP